nr:WASH complex subunit 2-like [Aegilops tauschii subsp. strangulata]
MCEYTGDAKDPQRHCQIELTDEDINDMTKTALNESLADCSKTGLNPFCVVNKPPAADSSFWNKKLQDKPTKKTRTKNKAPKKPAKKKTNPSELFDLDDNDESEDDAEASRADDEEGTSHSSSGDSTGTQVPMFKTIPGAMAKPSKKLKVNKPSEDPKVADPEKYTTSESLDQASEAAMDDTPPEEHPVTTDPMNVDPENAKPPSPAQPAQETEDVIAELNMKESPVNYLRQNIQTQQSETSKAKLELNTALENIENLKKDFSAERTGWETEKAALLKRAEDAEVALTSVTDECSGLKYQINSMTTAIFGSKSSKLGQDMRIRLKAVYH